MKLTVMSYPVGATLFLNMNFNSSVLPLSMVLRAQLGEQAGRELVNLALRHLGHLDGHHSVWHGTRCLGRYDPRGRAMALPAGRRPEHASTQGPYTPRSSRRPYLAIPRSGRRGPRLPVGPKDEACGVLLPARSLENAR